MMELADRKIGAIIVAFNNVHHTLCTVESLLNSDYGNIEILVVDNGSGDAYMRILSDELKRKCPNVGFLHLEKIGGYGRACNEGARFLTKKGCDVLLFLNNDITLGKDSVSYLAQNFEEEKVALIGPKVYSGLSNIIHSAGGFFNRRLTMVKNRGGGEIDKGQYDARQEVEFVNGCAFMISAPIFTELGGFDEGFYYYSEETDLCYRIIKKGYKIIYEPRAKVHHWPSTTIGGESKRAFYYLAKSHLQFVRKHAGSKSIFLYNLLYVLYHFVLYDVCLRLGQILTRVIAVFNGIKDCLVGKTGQGPYG